VSNGIIEAGAFVSCTIPYPVLSNVAKLGFKAGVADTSHCT
jgi:hypothetical protein